ncbi:ThiF family adenylyltransferase [Ferruginibacter albus]|uniref:ThiF family adenylyltransferase n=1 Tax=Ferruginibacter albus TaxID=2875540 RepID=UPI001CC8118B|nr:ThiF family adenylyltransferase [Ferruginibacter albus]UAY51296.1 ThiF family adenylyltransferase [Ferruginibacter albus]
MKSFSVIIKQSLHEHLYSHLIREDGQEDLCFATYIPSTGVNRSTGIISHIIFPLEGERHVHGNVGFLPNYFERALIIATERKEGLVFLHSHPSDGWQGMSDDDVVAETRLSPATLAATGYPLLGLTLGTDGAWSARYWLKNKEIKRRYDRYWCETVRVIGKGLSITFNDDLIPPNFHLEKQLRTISAWGTKKQEDISRLKIGIVGLGSVGSIVAEILARTGISKFILIDFDSVEEKNLDRLTNVFANDIGKSKVTVIASAIEKSATAPKVEITECEYSICEQVGYEQALDCDILFSCVDRPWPRQVLNFIGYAHLIPVIDGGILVRTNKRNGKLIGADWKTQIVGYRRTCLECLGQYKTENAVLEKSGKMDDPSYMAGLDARDIIDAHENVFCFSSHLASMEVFQFISLFVSPSGISDIGQQMYHLVTGVLDRNLNDKCNENCFFPTVIGKGDLSGISIYGFHEVAEKTRQERLITLQKNSFINKPRQYKLWEKIKNWLRSNYFRDKS